VNPQLQRITAATRVAELERSARGCQIETGRARSAGSLRRFLRGPRNRPNRSNLTSAASAGAYN